MAYRPNRVGGRSNGVQYENMKAKQRETRQKKMQAHRNERDHPQYQQ